MLRESVDWDRIRRKPRGDSSLNVLGGGTHTHTARDGDTAGTPPDLRCPLFRPPCPQLTRRCWWWRRSWRGTGRGGRGGAPAASGGSSPRGRWPSWGAPGWRLGRDTGGVSAMTPPRLHTVSPSAVGDTPAYHPHAGSCPPALSGGVPTAGRGTWPCPGDRQHGGGWGGGGEGLYVCVPPIPPVTSRHTPLTLIAQGDRLQRRAVLQQRGFLLLREGAEASRRVSPSPCRVCPQPTRPPPEPPPRERLRPASSCHWWQPGGRSPSASPWYSWAACPCSGCGW